MPDLDTEVKISSEAAERFVNSYYHGLNHRNELKRFYVNSTPTLSMAADISINGAVVPTPEDYDKLLDSQGSGVHYEIESLDAHVVNPSFRYGVTGEKGGGQCMSIAVTAMGRVQFGKGKDAPQNMFNETFILVSSDDFNSMGMKPASGAKRWLIMSQNFRML